MSLSLVEKKALVGTAAFLVGLLLLRRSFASGTPKGEVFIHPIQERPSTWGEKDAADVLLADLQRKAVALLSVDLDLMAPTHSPSPSEVLDIQDTIRALKAAGKTGEADHLSKLLRQAQTLRGGEA